MSSSSSAQQKQKLSFNNKVLNHSEIISSLFDPAFEQIRRDVTIVQDKYRKAKLRVDEKKKEKQQQDHLFRNNNNNDNNNNNGTDDHHQDNEYEDDHLLVEYGSLFGIEGEDDLQARKDQKNKQITNLPQARLPLIEVKEILLQGETFLKVFGKILTQLELNVESNHDHSKKFVKVSELETAATSEDSSLEENNNISNKSSPAVMLKGLAKIIGSSPSKFPTLFEHFLANVSKILTRFVALAAFADCQGTNVLITPTTTNNNNSNTNSSISFTSLDKPTAATTTNTNNSSNQEIISKIAPITRQTAQGMIFAASLQGSKVSHTCPRTLIEMVLSKEYSQRLAEAVVREFERGYRKMVFEERRRLVVEQQQKQKHNNQSSSNHQNDDDDSATVSVEINMKNDLPSYPTDSLQSIWSAFQKEQLELQASSSSSSSDQSQDSSSSSSSSSSRLAAQWLLFVRLLIAPRLLKLVSSIIDPLAHNHHNNNTHQHQNQIGGDGGGGGVAVDFFYNATSSTDVDEDSWLTFDRLYRRLLIPSLSSHMIDCDSVRTILYRALLMFETKVKRASSVLVSATKNDGSNNSKNSTDNNSNSMNASSSLMNWANFSSQQQHQQQQKSSSSSSGSNTNNKTMLDLISDALSRHFSAAVYEANFSSPDGYSIKIAEGEGLGKPIQFYLKDKVQIFAKKGKLKNLSTPFLRIMGIDDLVKFARSK